MSPLTPEQRARALNDYCTVADDCRHHPVTISYKHGDEFVCEDCGEPLNEEAWFPPTDYQKLLLESLVGDKHRWLYVDNATFKVQMDMLTSMLPVWIDALAVEAAKTDRVMKGREEQMTRATLVIDPELLK